MSKIKLVVMVRGREVFYFRVDAENVKGGVLVDLSPTDIALLARIIADYGAITIATRDGETMPVGAFLSNRIVALSGEMFKASITINKNMREAK